MKRPPLTPVAGQATPDPAPELVRRVWIENVRPNVDDGRYPIKRTVGEEVRVTADIFTDGHDKLAAVLIFRPAADEGWREIPMEFVLNDVWRASFPVAELHDIAYTVEAWIDPFATWRDALVKKFAAGQNVASELEEGAHIVRDHAARAVGADRHWLEEAARELADLDTLQANRVARATGDDLASLMRRYPDRSRATRYAPLLWVDVNRVRARYGAWYEMFPRSALAGRQDDLPGFRAAEERLPDIARMGFEVLYLPPIHPIGERNRKGPNNVLAPGPGAPGSPWAIGSRLGGHRAIHPELGTLDDFHHFVAAAAEYGLETAIDIAWQCAPDHPWVAEHPEWFRHRPDGSIQYAENPPKKYQDIYPLNFEGENWQELWRELRDVVLYWVEQGVKIFRVDNPHTKSLSFWQWLIAEVKEQHPDTIFLSEAFTRPKVMYALAKAGFDQSYTYFTWRNTRWELTHYLEELTRPPVSDFFRPNFFANTPDILPEFLQFGGRAAFEIRLVLAATLAASYGIYSGYEICENVAVPGSEEYQDSEKFQLVLRDWDRPDNISDLIARVNVIRAENPALHSNERLQFHAVDNEQMIFYSKTAADRENTVLVVVNLDPHHGQEGWLEMPLEQLGLAEHEAYQMHDLLSGERYLWQGRHNYVELDPATAPAQIFRLRRRVRTEKDFDYYM
ncbi:MAG: alpha-1,4-glucan--maltose-1-phosphate maltosyltransferase [Candidatus Krumholzibacteriia bacterium]